VVFGESDTVSHHFWLFHDPASPRHRPGFDGAIQRVYVHLDEAVGRLIDAAGPDTVVGVVSDHGFGGTGTGVVHLNNWLAESGYLHYCRGGGSWMKSAAMHFVPEAWRGALFRRLKGLATRAEGRSRLAGIDWPHTTAWSEELNYFPSIRLNLGGREPEGVVRPSDYAAVREELCRRLETWECVRKAWTRDELYQGKFVSRAPDIVLELELEDGYSHSCLRARGGPSFRRIRPEEHLGGKERGMNGSHRPVGVLLLSEPSDAQAARLEDIAPTVLACLDVPSPPTDGRSLLGRGSAFAATGGERPECPYTREQERILERRLRGLGYYE
jgi:predicted AlkP superfamily phosphohydrolase/phosphomutase